MCLYCGRPEVEGTELCDLARKYGTDKVPPEWHSYTPVYYELMKNKRDIKKMLEIGIGTVGTMGHIGNYKVGASLRMWRDFFPQATIFGCDIEPEAMIKNEDRIKTFLCDQSNGESLKRNNERNW